MHPNRLCYSFPLYSFYFLTKEKSSTCAFSKRSLTLEKIGFLRARIYTSEKIGLKEKTSADLFILLSSSVFTTHLLPLLPTLPLLNSYAWFFLQKSLNTLQRVYMHIVQKKRGKKSFFKDNKLHPFSFFALYTRNKVEFACTCA